MPRLKGLFAKFLDNEYYEIKRKFKEMEAVELIDTEAFVKGILEKTKLFRYECSDRNDDPSKKVREVLAIIEDEPFPAYSKPNLWVGYNAFNDVLHNTLKKTFSQQEKLDRKLFDTIYEMV